MLIVALRRHPGPEFRWLLNPYPLTASALANSR
jgi:hypothetical protein